ncbi:unnamed protein product, partial [Allacma fusca]
MQDHARFFIGAVLFGALFRGSMGELECQGTKIKLTEKQIEHTKECLGYHGATSIWKLPAKDFP